MAKIGHENICEVTDVGQRANGMPYIVMQLLHGRSLAAEIAARGPLRIGRAVDIATQALTALSAAHAAGIVHRDMKPDNIFFTRVAGRDDFVKLLDFGISKVRSAAGSGGVSAGLPAPRPVPPGPPELMGRLTVSTVPGTQVFLDGAAVAAAALSGREVAAGPHRLRFVNAERGIDREETVVIRAGRETRIVRTAEQLGRARVVAVAPADAVAASPPARDAGADRGSAIRRDAGTAVVSGVTDAGAAIGPPPDADGGLVRIRHDTGGQRP